MNIDCSHPRRALLIDDDPELTAMLADYLSGEGFSVMACHTIDAGLRLALTDEFDVIILDLMFESGSGLDLLTQLRTTGSSLPVLLLTGRGEAEDRVLGLETGADDYLVKPFEPRELVARLHAILRRSTSNVAEKIELGNVKLDSKLRCVTVAGEPVVLTGTEFRLLQHLLVEHGNTCGRRALSLVALGREPELYDRSIDMHMSNIRHKMSKSCLHIAAVRGAGYVLTMNPNPQ